MSILDFLSTNMAGQILLSLTIPTLGTNEKFATHKVFASPWHGARVKVMSDPNVSHLFRS